MTRDEENVICTAWLDYIDACVDARRRLFVSYVRAFSQPHASNLITNGSNVACTMAMMYQTTWLPGLPGLSHFPLMLRELKRGSNSVVIVGNLYEQGLIEKNGVSKDQVFNYTDILEGSREVDFTKVTDILLMDDLYARQKEGISTYDLMSRLYEKFFPPGDNTRTHVNLIIAE